MRQLRHVALGLLALACAGCVSDIPYPPPVLPPPPPPVVDPAPPPAPPPPVNGSPVSDIDTGWTYAQVVAVLGEPAENPPEPQGMPDVVRWDVVLNGVPHGAFVTFVDGRVVSKRMAPLVDVE